tara:strand:+ start:1541 stop:1831 length:291 start_codon:yes stop_codon:yes gene_type:complete
MKIAEKSFYDKTSDKLIIQKTHDVTPEMQRAEMIREAGLGQSGESKLVGTIPLNLIAEWCKEAGVKWSDISARQEVMKRKILSGEFDKFRVWKGTF